MKKQSEKKSIVKSIKLSPNQYEWIQKQAQEKGMNFSEYMVDCAVHGQNGLTPQMAVKIQEIANTANELADRLDYHEYETKEQLQKKAVELDELFRLDSPLNCYEEMMKDIDKIAEGAEKLWAYLK